MNKKSKLLFVVILLILSVSLSGSIQYAYASSSKVIYKKIILDTEGKYISSNRSIEISGTLYDDNYEWIKGFELSLNKKKNIFYITRKDLIAQGNQFKFEYKLSKNESDFENVKIYTKYDTQEGVKVPSDLTPGYFELNVFDVQFKAKEKTIKSIKETAKKLMAKRNSNKIYEKLPSDSPPYKPGKMTQSALNEGLNAVKMYRYLANLPYKNLSLDEKSNLDAQYGAVVLSRNNKMTHYPDKPNDMPDSFYKRGYGATSTSNICYSTVQDSKICVGPYINDNDLRNGPKVGHRLSILNAFNTSAGFGKSGDYSVLQFNRDYESETPINWRYIAWPAEGYMPIEYFKKDLYANRTSISWSIVLNPLEYNKLNPEKIIIEISKKGQKKKWRLNSSMNKFSHDDNFMKVYTESLNPRIIFRPGKFDFSKKSEVFNVKITGLNSPEGKNRIISYDVKFFSINK